MRAIIVLGLCFLANVAVAAKNSDVTYNVTVRGERFVSATALISSDTLYIESKCMGGMLTLVDACITVKNTKRVQSGLVYHVTMTNAGTGTVDATLLLFSEPFTSPGDNVAWAMGDGEFRKKYLGRVDLSQNVQVEGGGDTYGEATEVNVPYYCSADDNLYGQLIKNKVGSATIGGDTRSASKDMSIRVGLKQNEPK